jgi:chemotaxis protein MotB
MPQAPRASAADNTIKQVTQILAGIEGRKFQVTGHTDNIPIKSAKFKSNWELSTQRAVEVVKYMMNAGMDPKRLSAAGYADTLPISDNGTDEGRRQNRRIEIVVVPNIEDLPPMDEAAPKAS